MKARIRGLAYLISLIVLAAAVWGPLPVAAQVFPPAGGVSTGGNNDWTGTNQFTSTVKVYQTGTHTGTSWISFAHDGTNGVITTGAGVLALQASTISSGTAVISASTPNGILLYNAGNLGFTSGAAAAGNSAAETYWTRAAPGVFKANLTGGAAGWVQNAGGRTSLAADYTNATASFTSTALSVTVITGRKYTFKADLFLIDSTAGEGAQIDFNGGTATATDFRVHCTHFDTTAAVLKNTQVTALASVADSVATTGTGQNLVTCAGSFEPSGSGTFIVRGAQVTHTTGTLTINRGSSLWVEDMP